MNPLDISRIGLRDGIYEMVPVVSKITTTRLKVGERTIEWSTEHLGYVPEMVNDDLYLCALRFRDDTDAMLFKIAFAHLWQD